MSHVSNMKKMTDKSTSHENSALWHLTATAVCAFRFFGLCHKNQIIEAFNTMRNLFKLSSSFAFAFHQINVQQDVVLAFSSGMATTTRYWGK